MSKQDALEGIRRAMDLSANIDIERLVLSNASKDTRETAVWNRDLALTLAIDEFADRLGTTPHALGVRGRQKPKATAPAPAPPSAPRTAPADPLERQLRAACRVAKIDPGPDVFERADFLLANFGDNVLRQQAQRDPRGALEACVSRVRIQYGLSVREFDAMVEGHTPTAMGPRTEQEAVEATVAKFGREVVERSIAR
jgi:hypothetical protein